MEQLQTYIAKAMAGAIPYLGAFLGIFNYVLFPDKAILTSACAVGALIILDIITKYVALSHQAGGYMKAVRNCSISSNKLWEGTRIKLYSYLVVAILVGLSYRVVQLEQLSVFLASVVYSILFLREAQSVLENLCDAGADFRWLLRWTKNKQDQIFDQEGIGEEDDNNETI